MTLYWLMIVFPIFMTLNPNWLKSWSSDALWLFAFITIVFVIGFRHETGGDFVNYILAYDYIKYINLSELFTRYDLTYNIGFKILIWFSEKYFEGQFLANIVCAIIFVYGLFRFCNNLPNRWLALSIAMPYLVIVIGIGYTRQSAAIGFLLLALMNIDKTYRYFLYIMLGALFHNTVIMMLAIGFIYNLKITHLNTWIYLLISLLVIVFFSSSLLSLWNSFHSIISISHGGQIRMLINVLAAIMLFNFKKRYIANYIDYKLWSILSVICIILFPFSFVYSGAVDRIGLYFIPLQLVVFTKIASLIRVEEIKALFITLLLSCYVLLFLIWINFGIYATGWYPYRNIFFKDTSIIHKTTGERPSFWYNDILNQRYSGELNKDKD